MQDNSLTFSVDADHVTFADQVFERFESRLNSSIYHGENHVIGSRNLLAFNRALPKANGNFKGFVRSSTKVTQDIVVLGVDGLAQLTVPAIIKTEYIFPVGIATADSLALRRRNTAIQNNEPVIAPLTDSLVI